MSPAQLPRSVAPTNAARKHIHSLTLSLTTLVSCMYANYRSESLNCTGRITAIFCNETADGQISEIGYFNPSVTGVQHPGCSEGNWTGGSDKTLTLAVNESITVVKTCGGGKAGYVVVGGARLSCLLPELPT